MGRARRVSMVAGWMALALGASLVTGCRAKSAGVGVIKTGERCATQSACVSGDVCLDNVCRQLCSSAALCPSGLGCVASVCGACTNDSDCANANVCQAGVCVRTVDKSTGEACVNDDECAAGSCRAPLGACCLATCTLAAPSGLAVGLVAPSDIALGWLDNSDTETGYVIERCTGAACVDVGAVYTIVASLPPDSTAFSDLGLASETYYSYRVSLEFGTKLVAGSVAGVATAPRAPTQVEVLEAERTPTALIVRWVDMSASETGYRITYVRICPSCATETPVTVLVGANEVSAQLDGLKSGSVYDIRVATVKGTVASTAVGVVARTTAPALDWGPAAPSLAEVGQSCELSVPGVLTLAPSTSLSNTLGSVAGATVISAVDGVTANVTDLTPGARAVTWTATDSTSSTTTIATTVTLALGATSWLWPQPPRVLAPELVLGYDTMSGRQPVIATPCSIAVAGRRASLSAGERHTCVLTTTGGVKCWGENAWGQLGLGNSTRQTTPVVAPAWGTSVLAMAGGEHACALLTTGAVTCAGPGVGGVTPLAVTSLGTSVVALTTGTAHTCVLTNGGAVKCWGSNMWGELGLGDSVGRATPVDVTALGTSIVSVSAGGGEHTCALTAAGSVKCWGRNYYGQLGLGDTTDKFLPLDVTTLGTSVIGVTAGSTHTCAMIAGGGVKCWGYNGLYGTLGIGDSVTTVIPTPVDVSALGTSVVALAAGGSTCALLQSGAIKCWGANWNGQLGLGDWAARQTPVEVTSLGTSVVAVGVGAMHACALSGAGLVKCWGYGGYSALGLGDTVNRSAPVDTAVADGAVLTQGAIVIAP